MRARWEIDAIDALDDAREWRRVAERIRQIALAARRPQVKVKRGRGQRRNRRNAR